jgi:hypothetical protein
MHVPYEDVTADDVREILGRFLPPGSSGASVEGDEYVVHWRPSAALDLPFVVPDREWIVRSRTSFEDAVHRLVAACASVFLAYSRVRESREQALS